MKRAIEMTINGEPYAATVEHRLLLVDFIREVACLTGTHIGCGFEGRCGACSVIVNGDAIKACLMLAVQADGAEVYTIEGLAQRDALHPLQEAFRDKHGLQCGFCTPGFLMTLYDYLNDADFDPSEQAIRTAMSGVICRCTGYVHIVEAVQQAAQTLAIMSVEERRRWLLSPRNSES